MIVPIPLNQFNRTFFLVQSIDPTRTLTLRNRFVRAMESKFDLLLSDIREALVDLDVLGLEKRKPFQSFSFLVNASGLSPRQFDFASSDDKIASFVNWLKGKNQDYLLSGGREGIRTIGQVSSDARAARNSWMNTYLDSAYQQGIKRARQELKKKGVNIDDGMTSSGAINVAFNSTVHADRVGLIYTRAYTSLQGITAAMESTVSDVLAMGMADGRGPKEMARLMTKTLTGRGIGDEFAIMDSLGRFIPAERRAEVLARTEVIRAHHSANIGEYKAAGIMGINVQVEYLTAGDDRVCKICAPLNKKIFKIEEAEHLIPVHPQCRCVALPYIPEDEVVQEVQRPSDVFIPAITTEEARQFAIANKLAKTVDYTDFPVEVANDLNRSVFENLQKYPELKGKMSYLGNWENQEIRYRNWLVNSAKMDPETAKDVAKQALQTANGAWAHFGGPRSLNGLASAAGVDGIAVNPFLVRTEKVLAAFKAEVLKTMNSGFHPVGMDSLKAVFDHEMGHAIDFHLVRDEYGEGSLYKKIKAMFKKLTAQEIRQGLSEYATTSQEEFFAEAWAEYVNNPNPRPLATKVGKWIEKNIQNKG